MVASAHLPPLPFRSPQRISITVPHHVFATLQQRSDEEGRSLSNLAAYLLESVVNHGTPNPEPSSQAMFPWGGNGHR